MDNVVPGKARRLPVMADVAARAGVSHQTVSRVLNSPDLVRPATRLRVEEAIAALGYRRNMSARALATSRSHLIGVVTPAVTLFGPSHTSLAIQEAARAFGYATISAATETARTSPTDVLDFFLTLGVDGIIVVAPTMQTAVEAQRLAGTLPVVAIATDLPEPGPLHVVAIDNEQGARDATAHLIGLGHERIAHIAGPFEWFDARARVVGWQAELADAGLPVPEPVSGGWEGADGYAGAQQLLAQRELPTAVFAANDYMALGAMRAFHQAGLRIPEDIAVVGYDDVAGCEFYEPPLTTVRQPFEALGRHAIDTLFAALEGRSGDPEPNRPELVVRESCGARRGEPVG
ncbi:LacI family DNA-binding transcriptional regulator [Georgenia sp. Marseille-Q6866]